MEDELRVSRRNLLRFDRARRPLESTKPAERSLSELFKRKHLRPPGALPEVDFLATCTRCHKCRDACRKASSRTRFRALCGVEK